MCALTIIIHNPDSGVTIYNFIPVIIRGEEDCECFLVLHQVVSPDVYGYTLSAIPCGREEQGLSEVSFIVIGISSRGNSYREREQGVFISTVNIIIQEGQMWLKHKTVSCHCSHPMRICSNPYSNSLGMATRTHQI